MTSVITLRDYVKFDADRLAALANNENVSKYLVYTFPFPYTNQDAAWWIDVGSKMDGFINKVIEYQGEFVGGIGIKPQAGWKSHSAEIGYWLGEDYWGMGIATLALAEMSNMAFSDLKYKKLFAPVLSPNKQSMRVLEKCGYELEGVLKQDVFKQGQYYDIYHFARYSI